MAAGNNDLFRVAFEGTIFAQKIILTHHYAILNVENGGSDAAATTELLEFMRNGGGADQFCTEYLACMPSEYTLDRIVVQKVAPVRAHYQTVAIGDAGTHASDCRTANQSGIITFGSLLAGRTNVSNRHIGPIPEGVNVQVDGALAPAYKTLLSQLGTEMRTVLGGIGFVATWVPAIPHPDPAGSFTLIFNSTVGLTVNTMRRRTVGRGI